MVALKAKARSITKEANQATLTGSTSRSSASSPWPRRPGPVDWLTELTRLSHNEIKGVPKIWSRFLNIERDPSGSVLYRLTACIMLASVTSCGMPWVWCPTATSSSTTL